MPDEEPVVWPDDPAETDAQLDEADASGAPAAEPSGWPTSFDEALKQAQAVQEPLAHEPEPAIASEDHPTQPSIPAIPAKTIPPEPVRTEPSVAALGTADEMPTSTFKTPLPGKVSSANGEEPAGNERGVAAAEPEASTEPEPEPTVEAVEAKPAEEAEAEPASESVPEPEQVAEPEPAQAAEPEPAPEPEPEPVEAPAPEAEPVKEPEPAPEPVKAAEPAPEPAPKADEWVPMPENPPVPSWAPNFGVAIQHPIAAKPDAPAATSVPGWAPSTSSMPAASRQATSPSMPAQGSRPPQPAAAAAPVPPAPSGGSRPPDPARSKSSSSWEIVPPKVDQAKQAYTGPSAEDKSYAEWFSWAKRSGAPAGACHAAAQGAFRALAAGHDMNTAVQWATLAMAQPPGLVSASRQLYCAWYSLGNIDLRLPTPQAHAFATGAIGALEGGADAPTAHQAGLAAAGVTA